MQKINKFSKVSQDLIADLNNTEIFELCENSSKQQCPDCNAHWELGIIYCSCGRNMKSWRSPTEFDKNNRDVTSIPGYVIEKNSSRGTAISDFSLPSWIKSLLDHHMHRYAWLLYTLFFFMAVPVREKKLLSQSLIWKTYPSFLGTSDGYCLCSLHAAICDSFSHNWDHCWCKSS